jgi:hypothetical protein
LKWLNNIRNKFGLNVTLIKLVSNIGDKFDLKITLIKLVKQHRR